MKKIYTAIAFGLLSSVTATGQVIIDQVDILRNGDTAQITFQTRIDPKTVKSNYKLILTPVIYNEIKKISALTPIVVQGRRRAIMDRRNKVTSLPGAHVTRNGDTFSYTTTVPYQNWFPGSSLRFERQLEGCSKALKFRPVVLAYNMSVTGDDVVSMQVGNAILILEKNASMPDHYVGSSEGDQSASAESSDVSPLQIHFKTGSARLDPYNSQNGTELNRLLDALRAQQTPLNGQIEIIGYASPSGQPTANRTLAENRALSVRNYLLDNISSLRTSDFRIINGGENWDKLHQLVDKSTMPSRWQVLDIIDNTPAQINYQTNTSRKKALMDLNGGSTWKYLENRFFPQLTTATIKCPALNQTATPALEQDAMLDNTAIINAAIDLIGERKAAEALAELSKVENDPRAWNPMGVAYVLQNDIAKARAYFEKAIQAGYHQAKMNLDQLGS